MYMYIYIYRERERDRERERLAIVNALFMVFVNAVYCPLPNLHIPIGGLEKSYDLGGTACLTLLV